MRWIHSGGLAADWALRVDTLSAVMLVVVTTVSSLVHIYSHRLHGRRSASGRGSSAYLSLFTFAMLALVTADDFMQLFFGWEGVGLACYLLIGFWYDKPTGQCRGDQGLRRQPGRRLRLRARHLDRLQAVRLDPVRHAVFPLSPAHAGKTCPSSAPTATAMTVDLPAAVHGRDGQVGAVPAAHLAARRHGGPDPGLGPDPCRHHGHRRRLHGRRLSPLFEYAPDARMTSCSLIGAVTALFAATVGLVQNDIKRVIAYSTCSQLGYMFVALGVGAYGVGMFHLFTHAFFKALLFLGAGSVIHAMADEQDMRRMGGLREVLRSPARDAHRHARITAGLPADGFAGFYSKDAIIEAASAGRRATRRALRLRDAAVRGGPDRLLLLAAGVLHLQRPRPLDHESTSTVDDDHATRPERRRSRPPEPLPRCHARPARRTTLAMRVPLILLRSARWRGAVLRQFVGAAPTRVLARRDHHVPASWIDRRAAGSLLVARLRSRLAALHLPIRQGSARGSPRTSGPLYRFLYNKWFFDELYDAPSCARRCGSARLFWKGGDQRLIDGLGPDGVRRARSTRPSGWCGCRPATSTTTPSSCCSASPPSCPTPSGPGIALRIRHARSSPSSPSCRWSAPPFILVRARREPRRRARNVRWIALFTTLATFALVGPAGAEFNPAQPASSSSRSIAWFARPQLPHGRGRHLAPLRPADRLPDAALHPGGWKLDQERVLEYMIAFLMLETLVIGVFCALDLVLFYIFFEFGLVPMFLIIGIWGGPRRVYAAFKFFLYTLLGSVLMLAAIMAMYGTAGTSAIPS